MKKLKPTSDAPAWIEQLQRTPLVRAAMAEADAALLRAEVAHMVRLIDDHQVQIGLESFQALEDPRAAQALE